MTSRRRIAFGVVVAVQALFLLGMIGVNQLALATGDKVTLLTRPVDPYDPFRGSYATLGYEISNVNVRAGIEPGDRVYVPLHRDGDHWTGAFGYPSPPGRGEFIRGTVRSVYGHLARVDYGIETYYADEDEARRLQGAMHLLVTVALGDDGQAHISRVEPVR